MKILYREASGSDFLNGQTRATVDEFPLSDSILRRLREDLIASSRLLPPSASKFQEWTVGLLAR